MKVNRNKLESLIKKSIKKHLSLSESFFGYGYPEGAQYDKRAPWNDIDDGESEEIVREVKTEKLLRLALSDTGYDKYINELHQAAQSQDFPQTTHIKAVASYTYEQDWSDDVGYVASKENERISECQIDLTETPWYKNIVNRKTEFSEALDTSLDFFIEYITSDISNEQELDALLNKAR